MGRRLVVLCCCRRCRCTVCRGFLCIVCCCGWGACLGSMARISVAAILFHCWIFQPLPVERNLLLGCRQSDSVFPTVKQLCPLCISARLRSLPARCCRFLCCLFAGRCCLRGSGFLESYCRFWQALRFLLWFQFLLKRCLLRRILSRADIQLLLEGFLPRLS